jgi:hypothetical protein
MDLGPNSSEVRINLLDQPTLLPKGFGDQIERHLSSNTQIWGHGAGKICYFLLSEKKKAGEFNEHLCKT